MSALLSALQAEFALKDLESLDYFLGVEVQHSDEGLCLSQKKYTTNLLQRAGMLKCKWVSTPLTTITKLSVHDRTALSHEDATRYRSIVGAL
jgi:hypothetical protein